MREYLWMHFQDAALRRKAGLKAAVDQLHNAYWIWRLWLLMLLFLLVPSGQELKILVVDVVLDSFAHAGHRLRRLFEKVESVPLLLCTKMEFKMN